MNSHMSSLNAASLSPKFVSHVLLAYDMSEAVVYLFSTYGPSHPAGALPCNPSIRDVMERTISGSSL